MDITNYDSIYHKNAHAAETLMIRELSRRQLHGYKFRRQLCAEPFVIEFVCNELKLIIELYSELDMPSEVTDARLKALGVQGFHVARFCHSEVLTNLEKVIGSITAVVGKAKKAFEMSQLACRFLAGGFGKVRQTRSNRVKMT